MGWPLARASTNGVARVPSNKVARASTNGMARAPSLLHRAPG